MSDAKGQDRSGRIELTRSPTGARPDVKKTVEQGTVRQSFSHGRSKAVAVEVKRRRIGGTGAAPTTARAATAPAAAPAAGKPAASGGAAA
ncbi:MAG: IF-2-associated domain-containing protein, partial [Geminicoccaceae bacterium]|nr:IF-2-associated domain-containing protein [Geminicoccaceae bacterium]